jgi:hypothetical protein
MECAEPSKASRAKQMENYMDSFGDENWEAHSCTETCPHPIRTQWWTVGVCAQFVLEHWDELQEICHGAIQRFNTKAALNQIPSATWALMQTPEIKTDIKLVDVCNSAFFFRKNFEWLQRGNPEIGNNPGFLSCRLGAWYYLNSTSGMTLIQMANKAGSQLKPLPSIGHPLHNFPLGKPKCSRSQGQCNKSESNKKRRRIFF